MRFQKYLNEKLQPSQFRRILKIWKNSHGHEPWMHAFGGKYRIYLPYKGDTAELKDAKTNPIEDQLVDVIQYSHLKGYELKDYNKGIILNDKGREVKVTKFLDSCINYFKDSMEKNAKDDPSYKRKFEMRIDSLETLKKKFINDKSRALSSYSGNYLICISTHAYDVAGMSTGRGWNSCMTLPGDKNNREGGCNWKLIGNEVKEGTIVAYLIREDDKNLQHPIGRVLIKPYYHAANGDLYWLTGDENAGYGTVTEDFIKQVEQWVKKNLNGGPAGGLYNLAQGLDSSDFPEMFIENAKRIRSFADTVEFYSEFNDGEESTTDDDYGNRGYIVNDDYVFELDAIYYNMEDLTKGWHEGNSRNYGAIIIKLIKLMEKDEFGAEEFIEKLLRTMEGRAGYRVVMRPVFLLYTIIKSISKDIEKVDFNDDNDEISKILKSRNIRMNLNADDLNELKKLVASYWDRIYKVYG